MGVYTGRGCDGHEVIMTMSECWGRYMQYDEGRNEIQIMGSDHGLRVEY